HRALKREMMLGPAAAEAAEVWRIDAALFSQGPHVVVPPAARRAVAMDQDKRWPVTGHAVVQARVPDACVRGPDTNRAGREPDGRARQRGRSSRGACTAHAPTVSTSRRSPDVQHGALLRWACTTR